MTGSVWERLLCARVLEKGPLVGGMVCAAGMGLPLGMGSASHSRLPSRINTPPHAPPPDDAPPPPSTCRPQGFERFKGTQVHAKDFLDRELARGMRVVVVGAGKSALDCASEVASSQVAASVTWLFRQVRRRGASTIPRSPAVGMACLHLLPPTAGAPCINHSSQCIRHASLCINHSCHCTCRAGTLARAAQAERALARTARDLQPRTQQDAAALLHGELVDAHEAQGQPGRRQQRWGRLCGLCCAVDGIMLHTHWHLMCLSSSRPCPLAALALSPALTAISTACAALTPLAPPPPPTHTQFGAGLKKLMWGVLERRIRSQFVLEGSLEPHFPLQT